MKRITEAGYKILKVKIQKSKKKEIANLSHPLGGQGVWFGS